MTLPNPNPNLLPGHLRCVTGVYSSFRYVTQPSDSAAAINAKLSAGLHVVLTPGIYNLTESLLIAHSGQVLLGLGLATLVATGGAPCVVVQAGVAGARVAGILLQAGVLPTAALLQWGGSSAGEGAETPVTPPNASSSPGLLADVFARVGGPDLVEVRADVMVEIGVNAGEVVGDNMWLWRADHTVSGLVKAGRNPCATALRVLADDATMYGLAVEHTLADLVDWQGDRGRTFFFQSEFPYDVTQANYGDKGYAAYRVASSAKVYLMLFLVELCD